MNACTIVSRRELARARVLALTVREHDPDGTLSVLVLDADPRTVGEIEHARVFSLQEVAGETGELIAAANPPGARSIAVLPYFVSSLLAAGASSVLYLGSGQRVLGPLDGLTRLLRDHQVVLVSRLLPGALSSAAFGRKRAGGAFSRSLLGLRSGPATMQLLSAWPRYFDEDADGGVSAVDAWLEAVPAISDDVGVLRDPTYGADPYTLAEVPIEGTQDTLAVENRPVRTFDFSEMAPQNPLLLCGGGARVNCSSAPALARLCIRHANELLAAGFEQDESRDLSFAELRGGARLTPTMRRLLVKGVREGKLTSSPFSDAGRRAFVEYLNTPSDRGRAVGLTRLHLAIWEARKDLRAAYPHIDGPDGGGLAGWLCQYGGQQEGLNSALLPPSPEVAFRDTDPSIHENPPRWGVNVAGFFTAELGVGEAARLITAALDARGIPVLPIQGHLSPPSRQEVEFSYASPDEAAYPINIICINGDGIPVFAREAGRSFFEGRHTIATWWWEAGEPPQSWDEAFDYVDEVWVGSQHVHDLIAPTSPRPVLKMVMPVLEPTVADASRVDLGLPESGYLFLFVHDYHSVAARKNPGGTIEAFKRAFAAGSGAKLVIKSINAHRVPDEHDRIVFAASEHPDITLIDAYVPAPVKNAMIANCDCYVSLHRSEGFGLTVAEAMLLGKPVIATRYGGTLEFTNDHNSYLVDATPGEVGDQADPYPASAMWAEPDLEMAASLMRHVFENRSEASERGERARRFLSETHSPWAAGEKMEERLVRIRERMARKGVRTLNLRHMPPSEAGVGPPDWLAEPPRVHWGTGRRARINYRMHRPVADWVRSYIEHQRTLDENLFGRLARLDARVRDVARALSEQERARHAETLAVLRRVESRLAGWNVASDGDERAGQADVEEHVPREVTESGDA